MITKMIRHIDQEEGERDGSYQWEIVQSTLLKAFATYGAGDFDNKWIHLNHGGSSKKRSRILLGS